eukprot:349858-Chlamydomonas_euryale.AAC.3
MRPPPQRLDCHPGALTRKALQKRARMCAERHTPRTAPRSAGCSDRLVPLCCSCPITTATRYVLIGGVRENVCSTIPSAAAAARLRGAPSHVAAARSDSCAVGRRGAGARGVVLSDSCAAGRRGAGARGVERSDSYAAGRRGNGARGEG